MIVDKLTSFCNATALNTGAAGSYLIGDVIDLQAARDVGQGNPLWLVILVETTATSGGAATGTFQLRSDATAAVDPSTGTLHMTSPTFAVAAMTAGTTLFKAVLPLEGNVYERYLGLIQVTGTAAFTAGKIDAFLTQTPAAWKAYPDGDD